MRRFAVDLGERKAISKVAAEFADDGSGTVKVAVVVLVPTKVGDQQAYAPIACELSITEPERLAIVAVLQGTAENVAVAAKDDGNGRNLTKEKDSQGKGPSVLEAHPEHSGNGRLGQAVGKPHKLR